MVSAREKFTALVLTAPLARGDAIVCLCGEDGTHRAAVAQQLLIQEAAPKIVLTGGLDGGGRQSAKTLAEALIGKGVSPDRIIQDPNPTNTRQQAVSVVEMALENGWKRLLLVATPNHLPRATLTFIRAVKDLDIRIIPVTANQVPWFKKPEGVKQNRLQLLDAEFSKIASYSFLGDCATYEQGIKYLKKWEAA